MTDHHLFLASKRAAVSYAPDPDTGELRPWLAPGGTGNVVAEQAGVLNVSWIASADTDDDHRAARENPDGLMLSLQSGRDIRVRLLCHDRMTFDAEFTRDFADALLEKLRRRGRPGVPGARLPARRRPRQAA